MENERLAEDRRPDGQFPRPLEGIAILDFTRFQQGPQATQMLADMGARVIKIEEPGRGEAGRRLWRDGDGFSGLFEAFNRGKRSLTLNLRHPEAKTIVYQLSAQADVVAENFRRGTMERLGFGYDRLSRENPQLIYASASGYGPRGPMAERPSYDLIGMAMGGIMVASGGGPQREPRQPFWGLADASGAIMFAYGIVLALLTRERHGIGQQVDVSLLGTQLALQSPDLTYYLRTGHDAPDRGRSRNFPTFGHFETARPGEYVALGMLDPRQWPDACAVLELEELAEDERFASARSRNQHRDELEPLLEAAFRRFPREELIDSFNARGIPCGPVHAYKDVVQEPQLFANDYIVPREHPRFGTVQVLGLPVHLSRTPGAIGSPAPEPGQHADEVLRELGYGDAEITTLRNEGAI